MHKKTASSCHKFEFYNNPDDSSLDTTISNNEGPSKKKLVNTALIIIQQENTITLQCTFSIDYDAMRA